jgi:hypothetical protein
VWWPGIGHFASSGRAHRLGSLETSETCRLGGMGQWSSGGNLEGKNDDKMIERVWYGLCMDVGGSRRICDSVDSHANKMSSLKKQRVEGGSDYWRF